MNIITLRNESDEMNCSLSEQCDEKEVNVEISFLITMTLKDAGGIILFYNNNEIIFSESLI